MDERVDEDDDFIEIVPPVAVESPCILVCTLDKASGWCLGCGRTGDEIARWGGASDAERRTILAQLPARLDTLNR